MTTEPTPETARLHDEILEGRAEIAKLRDLLGKEKQRADSAIAREEAAEEAAAVPVATLPADRAALRDRIRRVLCERDGKDYLWGTDMLEPDEYGEDADAVLAVLPVSGRATTLRWAADFAKTVAEKLRAHHEFERSNGALDVMTELRRLTGEAEQDEPVVTVHAADNLSPAAQEALGALVAVAKRQFGEARQDPTPDTEAQAHACTEYDTWFDRTVCAEPCGAMHTRCSNCGAAIDGCTWFDTAATAVSSGQPDTNLET
ncbi:hypothetical protein ACGFZS_46940 [Streptomyces sp. NPDC048288]|uniref:hypothetical protein n=1 Tax=Streptomyces sp. NPDC048288 TaxID=3365529 RepID=UPI00371FFA61